MTTFQHICNINPFIANTGSRKRLGGRGGENMLIKTAAKWLLWKRGKEIVHAWAQGHVTKEASEPK
jgi:hypothetical protein